MITVESDEVCALSLLVLRNSEKEVGMWVNEYSLGNCIGLLLLGNVFGLINGEVGNEMFDTSLGCWTVLYFCVRGNHSLSLDESEEVKFPS